MSATVVRQHLSRLQRGGPLLLRAAPCARPEACQLGAALDAWVWSSRVGEVLVWQKRLCDIWSQGQTVAQNLWAALGRIWERSQAPPGMEPLAAADPRRVAWLDIETAGFMGRPVFLVGVMQAQGEDLVVTQFLARDYAQERALLERLGREASQWQVVVTFNGKCFDMPFLRERLAYHRLPQHLEVELVDVLWPARRRWRQVLPDCRLQTLERHVCRRLRAGDIPSALIPQRYHEFVRTQEPELIAPVLRHNRLDLLAMVELSALLLREGAGC